MATNVVLNIKVNDDELQELETGLKELGAEFSIVEQGTKKVGKGVHQLGKSGYIFQELNKMTGGLAGNVVDVYNGLTKVVGGLNLTKSALIATGIGAFVVALGVIVAYWDEISDYITGVNKKLREQVEYSRAIQEQLNFELELLKLKEEILITEGKNTDEIITKRRELIGLLQTENKAELNLLQTQRERLMAKIQEVTLFEAIASYAKGGRGFVQVSDDENELLKTISEGIDKATKQALELDLALSKLNNPNEDKSTDKKTDKERDKIGKINPLTGKEADAEIEAIKAYYDTVFDIDKQNKDALQESANIANQEFLNSELVAQAERTRIQEAQSKYREWLADQEAQAKVESFMLAANGFAAASQLIGQETAAGKAFAVASTLASTYLSAQQAYQSQLTISTPDAPVRAAVAAGTAVLFGLANVKKILSIKIPGQGGSSVSGGAASTPPAFNVVQSNPQNQLNQSLLERNNAPVQAFVVDKDVTTAQELRRNKVGASSL